MTSKNKYASISRNEHMQLHPGFLASLLGSWPVHQLGMSMSVLRYHSQQLKFMSSRVNYRSILPMSKIRFLLDIDVVGDIDIITHDYRLYYIITTRTEIPIISSVRATICDMHLYQCPTLEKTNFTNMHMSGNTAYSESLVVSYAIASVRIIEIKWDV